MCCEVEVLGLKNGGLEGHDALDGFTWVENVWGMVREEFLKKCSRDTT